ncbi:MAG: universal stress protein [Rhizobacter sp.]|nr:universal stress protein [Ferruginibacter sp.]
MKKILLILNESSIPQQVIKRAMDIAKQTNSLLEAIFLNDTNGIDFGYPFPNDLYLLSDKVQGATKKENSKKLLASLAREFKDECIEQNIEYKIEIDRVVSMENLLKLSCFADLIIADSKSDSDEYDLKDLLADAHCPLLLVSKNAEPLEKIYVAYDGSASSMYALKMFSYIFPECKDFPLYLFQFGSQTNDRIPYIDEIKSWAGKHFTNIKFDLIAGDAKHDLAEHIRVGAEKAIIIMGSYSTSSIARLFIKSTSSYVIHQTNASLFITHQ